MPSCRLHVACCARIGQDAVKSGVESPAATGKARHSAAAFKRLSLRGSRTYDASQEGIVHDSGCDSGCQGPRCCCGRAQCGDRRCLPAGVGSGSTGRGDPGCGAGSASRSARPRCRSEVRSEPANWVKLCGKDPGTQREICFTQRSFVTETNQPVMAMAVYDTKGQEQKFIRFILPLGFCSSAACATPSIRTSLSPASSRYASPMAALPRSGQSRSVEGAKSRKAMKIEVQNQANQVVSFQLRSTALRPLSTFRQSIPR